MEIPKIESFWDEQMVSPAHGGHRHAAPGGQQPPVGVGPSGAHSPYERNLNFATVAVDDGEYGFPKKKTVRDPLSHRIIEKRRRDRMNNCLADLARLLPSSSLRKGRGRIEKTEIVELAIKHLRHLQCHPCPSGEKCEYSLGLEPSSGVHNSSPSCSSPSPSSGYQSGHEEQFRLGFQECLSESMHFLVEQEGLYAGDDMCVRLVKHLNSHCETVLRDHWGSQGKVVPGFRRASELVDFKKAPLSPSSGYHQNGSSSGSDGNGGNDMEGSDTFILPVQNPQNLNADNVRNSTLDYEGENSSPSTPLSIEMSDALSEGKGNCKSTSKPPIPTIICSHSSSNNCGSPVAGSNGRSSDDGSANSSASFANRYKFKSNIKQRFTADCQVKPSDNPGRRKSLSQSGTEAERDADPGSDAEERISISEDLSVGCDESEIKRSRSESSCRRRSSTVPNLGPLTMEQISIGEKAAVPTAPIKSVDVASNTSTSPALSSPLDAQTPRGCDDMKVDEYILKGAHLPGIIGDHASLPEGKVPAFALHEKGLFYIPLTIDKSIVSSYLNKLEVTSSPPLYPVTISVCFLLHPDKQVKSEIMQSTDTGISGGLSEKVLCNLTKTSTPSPTPATKGMPYNTAAGLKPNKRGYRDPHNYSATRFEPQQRSSKESSQNRIMGSPGPVAYTKYQTLPLPSPSPSNSFDMQQRSCNSSPRQGSGGSVHNYQDLSNPMLHMNEISHRESEVVTRKGKAGGSSYSTTVACGMEKASRKRSVSSTPSLANSGATGIGYHSWSDKGQPSSHDIFGFHANTHNLPVLAAHSHAAAMGALTPMSYRHPHQNLSTYHTDSLRDKEMFFPHHEKQSRKTKIVDPQVLEAEPRSYRPTSPATRSTEYDTVLDQDQCT